MDFQDQQTKLEGTAPYTLHDPHLANLETHWRTLRHARHVPMRNDLDPSCIDRALPYSFILQRVAPGVARFRVAGQALHNLLKMDARGMPATTLFHPDARDSAKDLIEKAFQSPAIIGMPLISEGGMLRPTITGAMLLLPMQDFQGVTNRLLGAFVFQDVNMPRPRRFTIDPTRPMRCDVLGPTLATSQLIPKDPAQAKGPDACAHPALRLVVNNG